MEDTSTKEPRISGTQASLLVGAAVIFDLISLIPAVGQAIATVGSIVVFSIWFLVLGVPLVSPKKLVAWVSAGIIELIPLISALPGITAGVILMIAITRTEDRLGVQVLSTKGLANPAQIAEQLKPRIDRYTRKEGAPQQDRSQTGVYREGIYRKAIDAAAGPQRQQMNDLRRPAPQTPPSRPPAPSTSSKVLPSRP